MNDESRPKAAPEDRAGRLISPHFTGDADILAVLERRAAPARMVSADG